MKDMKGPSPNRNVSLSGSVENNENDSSVDKLISKFENQKITSDRHSTSGAPRKKILAEIKEIEKASDAEDHKNTNQVLVKSPPKKGVFGGSVSYYDHASNPKDDSSLKVYDPVTNLLSPRPQYLRYNPNRRREIVKRLEEECMEDFSSSFHSVDVSDEELSVEEIDDSCTSPPKVCVANQNDGGIIEEDNDIVNQNDGGVIEEDNDNVSQNDGGIIEEDKDKVSQNDGGVIEEDNDNVSQNDGGIIEEDKDKVSQNDGGIIEEDNDIVVDGYEEEEEEEEEERGWCLKGVVKLLLTLIACLLSTSYICSMNSPKESPIQQAIWDFKDSGVVFKNDTLEFVSTKLKDDGFFGVEVGSSYRVVEEEEVDEESHGETEERFEAGNLEWHEEMIENENEDSEDMVDVAAEFKSIRGARFEFKADEYEHLVDAKTDERLDDSVIWLDEDNASKDKAAKTETIGVGEISSGQMIEAETLDSDDASGYEFEMDVGSSNQFEGTELVLESISKEMPTESEVMDEIGSLELFVSHEESSDSKEGLDEIGDDAQVESVFEEMSTEPEGADDAGSIKLAVSDEESSDYMDEVDEIGDDAQVGVEKYEWNSTAIVGVSAILIVSTLLAFIYHFKNSRSTSTKEFEPVLKQDFAVEKNVNQVVLPATEKKVEFLPRAPIREAAGELARHFYAPTVELIGEIVVGQPSSLGRSKKYEMAVPENECNATLYQKHESFSTPSAAKVYPTSNSTSYGRFNTEKKVSKKEGGQSREAMFETPVRRSSRIRNRSAAASS